MGAGGREGCDVSDKSWNPSGPRSQSAHIKYLIPSKWAGICISDANVFEKEMLSKSNGDLTSQNPFGSVRELKDSENGGSSYRLEPKSPTISPNSSIEINVAMCGLIIRLLQDTFGHRRTVEFIKVLFADSQCLNEKNERRPLHRLDPSKLIPVLVVWMFIQYLVKVWER